MRKLTLLYVLTALNLLCAAGSIFFAWRTYELRRDVERTLRQIQERQRATY
jgi:cell division protein FtsL